MAYGTSCDARTESGPTSLAEFTEGNPGLLAGLLDALTELGEAKTKLFLRLHVERGQALYNKYMDWKVQDYDRRGDAVFLDYVKWFLAQLVG
jgi:hypothetical protein